MLHMLLCSCHHQIAVGDKKHVISLQAILFTCLKMSHTLLTVQGAVDDSPRKGDIRLCRLSTHFWCRVQ